MVLASWGMSRFEGAFGVPRRLRRPMLAGAAAAALAASFGTPVGAAFFAIEVLLGTFALEGLAPVLAANFTVIVHEGENRAKEPLRNLSALTPGEAARVTGISALCRGLERRRLLDLGLVPGTTIEAEFTSPSGDPTAYRVRGGLLALRREQADLIHVNGAAAPAGDIR